MTDFQSNKPGPQFGTLEPSAPSGDSCKVCHQPITGLYYRANGAIVCGSCADRIKRESPQDSHSAFVRGLVFGICGFLVALIAYSAIGILLQGWTIGYLSLGVGWVVGKAMMAGSRGIGGRRYQLVAVLLTYAAVSMAAIPISLATMKHDSTPAVRTTTRDKGFDGQKPDAAAPGQKPQQTPEEHAATQSPNNAPRMSLATALVTLALIGLASPFFGLQDGISGVLMLVILLVGMQFAWKITAARASVEIDGPFELSRSASA